MENRIVYRPYKYVLPLSVFFTLGAVFCFIFTGGAIEQGADFFFLAAAAIGNIWGAKFLYDLYNLTVFFEEAGVRITGGKHQIYRYVLWEEMPYAYYATNFKGVVHFILSPKALSRKEAKKFAKRGGNSTKLRYGDAVVIALVQDIAPIKEWIAQRALHVEDTTMN